MDQERDLEYGKDAGTRTAVSTVAGQLGFNLVSKLGQKSSVTERAVTGQNLFNNGRLECRSPFGKALARQAKANLHPLALTLVPCSCVQVRYGVSVLHEHRLRGLRSPRLAATEPTIPQGALGAPLTATFALVLARASYRSTSGAICAE